MAAPSLLLMTLLQTQSVIERLSQLLGLNLSDVLQKGLQAVGIVILAWIGSRLLKVLTRRLEVLVEDEDPTTVSAAEQRARTLGQLLNSIGGVVITIGAGLTILNLFINIAPLLAGVGVAGLAISFGAQSLVKDVIGGFFILLENQFGVGDIVKINGTGGVVEQTTMRVVMLRDVHGVLHVIPNGSITGVSNMTRGWSRSVLDIGVGYKEDVDRVIHVMRDIGHEFWDDPEWRTKLKDEPAVWGVEALADNSVNIRIIANTKPGKQWEVSREIRRRVKNRFDKEGIEIPFPQRTLHLGEADALLATLARRHEEHQPT